MGPKPAHSVLTNHLIDAEGEPTREALDRTLAFFARTAGSLGLAHGSMRIPSCAACTFPVYD
jgi:hypothetical protein